MRSHYFSRRNVPGTSSHRPGCPRSGRSRHPELGGPRTPGEVSRRHLQKMAQEGSIHVCKPRTLLRTWHFIPVRQERQPGSPGFKNRVCPFSYLSDHGYVLTSMDSVVFTVKWGHHHVPCRGLEGSTASHIRCSAIHIQDSVYSRNMVKGHDYHEETAKSILILTLRKMSCPLLQVPQPQHLIARTSRNTEVQAPPQIYGMRSCVLTRPQGSPCRVSSEKLCRRTREDLGSVS